MTSAIPPLGLTLSSLLRADLTALLRGWRTYLFNLGVPVLVLGITALRGHPADPAAAVTVVAFAITYGLMSSDLMGYPLGLARDRESGVLRRLRVTPAPAWAVMGSRLATNLAVNVVLVLVVAAIGAVVDGLPLGVTQFLLLVPAAALSGAVFLGIGQALVGLLRSASLVGAVGRVVFIVLSLAGLLGLTGRVGAGFATFSRWTPVGAAAELVRAALSATDRPGPPTGAVLACLGYLLICAYLGIRRFRWDPA